MSEFLTYKKISDLEAVTTLPSDAYIPVMDNDGVLKRIPRSYFCVSGDIDLNNGNNNSGTNTKPSVFGYRNGDLYHVNSNTLASSEEIFSAYVAGKAFVLDPTNSSEICFHSGVTGGATVFNSPMPITSFQISGNGLKRFCVSGVFYDFGKEENGDEMGKLLYQYLF